MPDLQFMFAENNDLSGPLPTTMGTLNLKRVHLDDNNFTGTIPTEFGTPPNLKQLYLHGNQFTGPVPASLAQSASLEEATFHYNNMEGTVSEDICANNYNGALSVISVDCGDFGSVSCECCTCGPPP